MITSHHRILVIGCGSIGERHVRTFLATQRADVVACDSRVPVCRRLEEAYGVATVADWQSALEDQTITGAVVATPAPLHVPMAGALLDSGRHVLIEKPLAIELQGADGLPAKRDRSGRFAAVAYVLRFTPALQRAREFVHAGSFGPLRQVTLNSGQHFPSFRPAYREIYYREHAQGGGAIQDALTHMANAVEWVAGPTTRVFCDAAHQVLEGVSVEDTVNLVARNGGVLTNYALTQFQAPNEARLDFHAEAGSVRVEFHRQRWGTMALGQTEWTWHAAPVADRDDLFVAQANAFLDGCEDRPNDLCTLEEGLQTLRFNLAALRSWREDQPVIP